MAFQNERARLSTLNRILNLQELESTGSQGVPRNRMVAFSRTPMTAAAAVSQIRSTAAIGRLDMKEKEKQSSWNHFRDARLKLNLPVQ